MVRVSAPAGQPRRGLRRLAWVLLVGLAALNLVAYLHARAMVTWVDAEHATAAPEKLSLAGRAGVLLAGVSIPRPDNQLTPLGFGLEYETIEIDNGQGQRLEAWYLPLGTEERHEVVAILFHGYAASKDTMLAHAMAFEGLGVGTLLVDSYGVGGSSGSGTSLGLREAHDVVAALAYARERWPWAEVVLYGQSMGGAAVLRAVAELGAEPDALVVESTFDRMLHAVGARFRRMGLPATPFAQLLTFWGGVHLGEPALSHDPVEYAARVTCPALVLQSEDDPNITSEQARSIHDALGGWKRYSEYPAGDHARVLAADPKRWAADVTALLEQLGGWR